MHGHNKNLRRRNETTGLLTWRQNRCQKCQRFLGLRGKKYCLNCTPHKRQVKYIKNQGYFRMKFYRHPELFNVGDYV